MKWLFPLFFCAVASGPVSAGVLIDLANNVCHLPTSNSQPPTEFHLKGCSPNLHIDAAGNAWAYVWFEKPMVPRRIAPVYPETHHGTEQINVTATSSGLACEIRSVDHLGQPMIWSSADWHSSTEIRRTHSESWVHVRYSLYCYAGRPSG